MSEGIEQLEPLAEQILTFAQECSVRTRTNLVRSARRFYISFLASRSFLGSIRKFLGAPSLVDALGRSFYKRSALIDWLRHSIICFGINSGKKTCCFVPIMLNYYKVIAQTFQFLIISSPKHMVVLRSSTTLIIWEYKY